MPNSNFPVKPFASPGIDSMPEEVGPYVSGVHQLYNGPQSVGGSAAVAPSDAGSPNPALNPQASDALITVGHVIKTGLTRAMSAVRNRRRGTTAFPGYFKGHYGVSYYKAGGTVDHNAGASPVIAGGPTAASSLVRVNTVGRPTRGMRLPVMPGEVSRSQKVPMPTGGNAYGTQDATIIPRVPGFQGLVNSVMAPPSNGK